MRCLSAVAVATALAASIACVALEPEAIAEKDLVPPQQLEEALSPVPGWVVGVSRTETVKDPPISFAETTYTKGPSVLRVKVQDSGLIAKAFARLTSGHEEVKGGSRSKSIKLAGIPGVENWNSDSKTGQIHLVVGNRFVLSIEGGGGDDLNVLRDFASRLDTRRLDSLKNHRSK